MSDDERNTVLAWIDAGKPLGDMADMPPPLPVSDTPWQLGDPDLILTMSEEFTPPPDVTDTYRCFVLPSGLTENRFISALQALPGNAQITHHVLFFLDETGESDALLGKDGLPGYDCFGGVNISSIISSTTAAMATGDILQGTMLGGWVPGARTRRLPAGIGVPLAQLGAAGMCGVDRPVRRLLAQRGHQLAATSKIDVVLGRTDHDHFGGADDAAQPHTGFDLHDEPP